MTKKIRQIPSFYEAGMRMNDEKGNHCKIEATAEEIAHASQANAMQTFYTSTKIGKYIAAAAIGIITVGSGGSLSAVFGFATIAYAVPALISADIKKQNLDTINANVAENLTGDRNDGAKISFLKTMASELFDQKKIYSAFKTKPLTDKNGVLRSDSKPF